MQLRYRAAAAVLLTFLAIFVARRIPFRPTGDPAVDQHLIAISVPAGEEADAVSGKVAQVAEALSAIPSIGHVQHRLPRPGEMIESVLPHFTLMLAPRELERVAAKLTPEAIRSSVHRNRLVLESPQSVAAKELVQYDPFNLLPIFLEKFGGGEGFEFDPTSELLVSRDGSTVIVVAQPERPATDLVFARALVERSRAISDGEVMTVVGDYAEGVEDVAVARRLAALGVVVIVLLAALAGWLLKRVAGAINAALTAAMAVLIAAAMAAFVPEEVATGAMPWNGARDRGRAIEEKFGVTGESRTIVITGTSLDQAIDRTAAATASLPAGSWSAITQFVPPRAEQLKTIQWLAGARADGRLSPERIGTDFQEALTREGFRADVYASYMAMFEQALTASQPITVDDLAGEELESLRDRYIRRTPGGYESLIDVTADLK